MARSGVKLSEFGRFLLERGVTDRNALAKSLGITTSYVSMLVRGPTTPGLKLANRIARWSAEIYGAENAFGVDRWPA